MLDRRFGVDAQISFVTQPLREHLAASARGIVHACRRSGGRTAEHHLHPADEIQTHEFLQPATGKPSMLIVGKNEPLDLQSSKNVMQGELQKDLNIAISDHPNLSEVRGTKKSAEA